MDSLLLLWNQIHGAERHYVGLLKDNSGFPEDQLKTVLCFFAAIPLGFVFKGLPNAPVLKHLFSILER
jgi:hypothetical protein